MIRLVKKNSLEDWHNHRWTGLGASDMPTTLGYNKFQSKLELFHKKVGLNTKPYINRAMLRGKYTEEFTSLNYQCWDGVDANHAYNIEQKKIIRLCEKYENYTFVENDDYPNLYVSPDRNIFDKNKKGGLEIKDTTSMYLNTYLNRISTEHEIQLKSQMMVAEFDYGCLAYIIDGANEYKEHFYDRDGIIIDDKKNDILITENDLKEIVIEFWSSIIKGRKLQQEIRIAQNSYNLSKVNDLQDKFDMLEPDPDFTLAFEVYLKENYYQIAKPLIEIQGTAEHEQLAEDYLKAKEQLKVSDQAFQLQKNKVLDICKNGHQINFGKGKYIKVSVGNKTSINVKI